ncbi:MAG: NAD(P)H-dependent oxidoreductase [Pseudomonadota bacterium]|nr:NAD(P)H-dependent oxidoreductase [Pseudomonadota bacterium]
MARALIVYAHPRHQTSRANRELLEVVKDLQEVTVRDLYEEYPDFFIDVACEQELVRHHDIIIFMFPFYWYSAPSLLKEWQDRVLDYGFAFGINHQSRKPGDTNRTDLSGKTLWVVTTAGGPANAFSEKGIHRHPLEHFLLPYAQIANLCGMRWQPPHIIYHVRQLTQNYLHQKAEGFRQNLLTLLREVDHA